jgi:hypothetical protein
LRQKYWGSAFRRATTTSFHITLNYLIEVVNSEVETASLNK